MSNKVEKKITTCTDLEQLDISLIDRIKPYLKLRRIESCEFGLTTLFLWRYRNDPHLYFHKDYLLVFGHYQDQCFAMMPVCKEEHFKESFEKVLEKFNAFDKPLVMYSVDEAFAKFVEKEYGDTFDVSYNIDFSDYIYDADRLRNLPGKKLRKKRNHINAFTRENPDNVSFRILTAQDKDAVNACVEAWVDNYDGSSSRIDNEIEGIDFVLEHEEILDAYVFGVFIDDELHGITIGSRINDSDEVIIHVEKANAEIRGLYPFLSQTYLNEIHPNVSLVNREEDLGIPGLRKSKESYEPIRLEHKYVIKGK